MLESLVFIGVQVLLKVGFLGLLCYFIYVFFILYRKFQDLSKKREYFDKIPGPGNFNYILGNIPLKVLGNPFRDFEHVKFTYTKMLTSLIGLTYVFKEDKIFRIWLGSEKILVVWGPETVESILFNSFLLQKSPQYKFLHPWLGTGLLTSNGQKWRSRRKLLIPAFHFQILHDFVPVFNEQGMYLVEKLKKISETNKEVDIVPLITACTLDIICETVMGVSIGAQKNELNEYCQTILKVGELFLERMTQPLFWPDFIYFKIHSGKEFLKKVNLLHEFTRKVIKDRKNELLGFKNGQNYEKSKHYIGTIEEENVPRRKAFMDLLLDHHINENDLSEEDIREEVDTFMFEGHDTTAMALSWIIFLLGHNPEAQEKLRKEVDLLYEEMKAESCDDQPVALDLLKIKKLKYLECVIKEGLRLCPSVPLVGRTVTKELDVNGYIIPEGTTVLCFIYQLHRNQEIFPQPERFVPDRFFAENLVNRHPFAFVPFSAGPRNCIGQRFAMSELKILLALLIKNFIFESTEPRDKIMFNMEIVLRPKVPLKVKFLKRN